MFKIKIFGKLDLKLVFWESISSHTHAFFSYIECFEVRFQKISFFLSKAVFFQNFDWSNLIFDQSKSFFKNYVSLCLVQLIEPVFRSIKDHISGFLKTFLWLFQHIFFKSFSIFLLSPTWQGSTMIFSSFFSKIFTRFSSLKAGKTILSLLLFLFSCFHAFKGHFRAYIDLGFLMIQGLFSEIDRWVLLGYCYIHVCCWLIWSIWGYMKNWKF